MDIAVGTLALVAFVVFVGAVFQGSIGFGANVIAQPLVFLIDPTLVPGSVLLANTFLSCLVVARDREAIDRRPVWILVAGVLTGTAIGVAVIRVVSADGLAVLIAVCVLTMVALLAVERISVEPSTRNVALASVVGGFTGTASGIGGPPMAMVYQRAAGPTVRGSLAGYFILASTVALVGLAIAGRFGWRELVIGVSLFPATGLGFLVSGRFLSIVDRGVTRPAILTVSAAAAVVLLARTVLT